MPSLVSLGARHIHSTETNIRAVKTPIHMKFKQWTIEKQQNKEKKQERLTYPNSGTHCVR